MNNRPIFNLIYTSWDWEKHFHFYGPENSTLEQFQDLCDDLLPEAGYRTALRISHADGGGWINWNEVVESLIPLLEQRGYLRFELPNHTINGSGTIGIGNRRKMDSRLGFATKLISDYNRALDEKISKEAESRKTNKSKLRKFLPQIMK